MPTISAPFLGGRPLTQPIVQSADNALASPKATPSRTAPCSPGRSPRSPGALSFHWGAEYWCAVAAAAAVVPTIKQSQNVRLLRFGFRREPRVPLLNLGLGVDPGSWC